jgi:muramoyltetrapeptide carboxypeptidase
MTKIAKPASAQAALAAQAATPVPRPVLTVFSPAGVVAQPVALQRAVRRLRAQGFDAQVDASARAKSQRFAGDDATRLAAIHRIADAAPAVALASRGGYGLSRLIDQIDWKRIARSVERGTRWVGQSDLTAFQLAAMAHGAAGSLSGAYHHDHAHEAGAHWAGPMACDDFGRTDDAGGVDDVTEAVFLEAMRGELEGLGFRTEAGFDGFEARGRLWGGNLTVLAALLGTPHWPRIKGGILFLEDVNEHPYRVERTLLQLHQAGVLGAQKAVLLGDFSGWRKSPLDRGYTLKTAVAHLRSLTKTPILTGLPHGHGPLKVCLPQGRRVNLAVFGRDVLIGW